MPDESIPVADLPPDYYLPRPASPETNLTVKLGGEPQTVRIEGEEETVPWLVDGGYQNTTRTFFYAYFGEQKQRLEETSWFDRVIKAEPCDIDGDGQDEIAVLFGSGIYGLFTMLKWDGQKFIHMEMPEPVDNDVGWGTTGFSSSDVVFADDWQIKIPLKNGDIYGKLDPKAIELERHKFEVREPPFNVFPFDRNGKLNPDYLEMPEYVYSIEWFLVTLNDGHCRLQFYQSVRIPWFGHGGYLISTLSLGADGWRIDKQVFALSREGYEH
ncbi:hypothetical protein FACS1894217_01310 [Clostridia bacterium]|nr:hypothetical protein FACS1894217_01310 [Clostridia bacterium]